MGTEKEHAKMNESTDQTELRVLRVDTQAGLPKTIFIALTASELEALIKSDGDMSPYQKYIILVVDGHSPSATDHEDATFAFGMNYTSIVQRRRMTLLTDDSAQYDRE
jgi:hypothetical protein